MEWSKYVLSVMVGGCLLVLYGKKGTGRNKWLFGAGTGTSLMAMELGLTKYNGNKIHGQRLRKAQVDKWCQRLFDMTQEEREQIPGMKAKRADIMPYLSLIHI